MNNNRLYKVVKIAIISVYLIFLAGATVRMTGSGMGCPDWPKCFGYYIPPTSEQQITWKSNTFYKKGFIIVKDEALFVAEKDLKTSLKFDSNNWKKYTKHNYAKFNKYHTWTEYINRLVSVISGIIFLFLIYVSSKFWKPNKRIFFLSYTAFFMMLFEAWLGKIVIDSNLKPIIITIHMILGLVIIALLLNLKFIIRLKKTTYIYNPLFNKLITISVIFSLIQIATGTQVRQFIDEQIKLLGDDSESYFLLNPDFIFYFHRSFTIVIIILNLALFYINQVEKLGYKLINWVVLLTLIGTITGVLMYYIKFPFGTQAIHLLSSAIMFGLQFYLWLQSRNKNKILTLQNR